MYKKENLLFVVLGGFFIANALLAEFIGVKLFSVEATLGLKPTQMTFFGQEGLSFNMTAGVLLWPVVFIMTDIINEYYGTRGVRILSYMAAGLILYGFLMVYFAISVEPASFWIDNVAAQYPGQLPNIDLAFRKIFGQGMWIIGGSLIAFLGGQLVDVMTFHWLRRFTGSGKLWLRATGSTLVSQLIDSFVVLFIAFYIGPDHWSFVMVMAVAMVNYLYKFVVAIAVTPLLYAVHWGIDTYLGKELAEQMIEAAAKDS
jgi:queuosine precursor transporter